MKECIEYMARFPISNGHDHPNEIAAYMFALLLKYDFLMSPEEEQGDDHIEKKLQAFHAWCADALG